METGRLFGVRMASKIAMHGSFGIERACSKGDGMVRARSREFRRTRCDGSPDIAEGSTNPVPMALTVSARVEQRNLDGSKNVAPIALHPIRSVRADCYQFARRNGIDRAGSASHERESFNRIVPHRRRDWAKRGRVDASERRSLLRSAGAGDSPCATAPVGAQARAYVP
jgi:hypothetical protein